MKGVVLGAILIVLGMGGIAQAADIPAPPLYKAPPPAAPAGGWSGWYVGGNVGAAVNASSYELDPSGCFVSSAGSNCGVGGAAANPLRTFANDLGAAAFTGGGQIGYNWQFGGWLAGIETDLNYSSLKETDAGTASLGGPLAGVTASHSVTQRLDWFGTFRGRAGLTPRSDWLLYVTGGLAYGNVSSTTTVGPVQCCAGEVYGGSVSAERLLGWTAGAGVEHTFAPGWSAKVEYLYVDLGTLSYIDSCITARARQTNVCAGFSAPPTYTTSVTTAEHVVRAGLNYHFDLAELDHLSGVGHAGPAYPMARDEAAVSRFYGGAEYLFWWAKGAPLAAPLVSTGPIDTTHHGFLINSDATILYGAPFAPAVGGNDTQNFPGFSGSRLTFGYWLDSAGRLAVEASAFALQSQSAGFNIQADNTGNPVLAIPLYNTISYVPGGGVGRGGPPNEDSLPIALPAEAGRQDGNAGVFTGGVSITNTLQLWGADATGVINLHRGDAFELSGLGGVRYLNLAESFNLNYQSVGVSGVYVGDNGTLFDQFQTRNQFYGALLGLRGKYAWGPLWAEVTARAAVGLSHEVLEISGGYTSVNYLGPVRTGPEGVFAQPSNEGQYSTDKLALVPEAQIKLGYNVTPAIRVTAGYDFLYYSSVVRPGDNINRDLPKGQTFQQGGSSVSTASPAPLFKTTDFYVQGFSVGLAASF